MKFFYLVFLIIVVFSCAPKNTDERNASDVITKADSLAKAHDNSMGTGWLELIGDSVRVVGSGHEILIFRFPNGQALDERSDNKAQGYLELSPEQEAVVRSVRFEFTVGELQCDDARISDVLGADPDTTYTKTINKIAFKVSEVGLGGRNPTNYTLYQFAFNNVCLSFLMEVAEASNVTTDPRDVYQMIEAIFEDFLGSLKMKKVDI